VYSAGGGDPETRTAARGVVRTNLTALARADGKAFCGTYTTRFLRIYRDSYARCVRSFRGPPKPSAPAPRIVWGEFLTASDEKVAVEFRVDGGRTQSYYLEFRRPPPAVGSTARWLIDLETVERE